MATPKKSVQPHVYHGFSEKRDAVIRFLTHKSSIEEIQRQYGLQRYQFQAWVGQVLDRDRTVIGIAARAHTAPPLVAPQRTAKERAVEEFESNGHNADAYLEQTMPDIVRELGVQALKELVAKRHGGKG